MAVESPSKSTRSAVCGRGRKAGFGRDLNLDFAAAGDSTRVLGHKVCGWGRGVGFGRFGFCLVSFLGRGWAKTVLGCVVSVWAVLALFGPFWGPRLG